MPDQTPKPQNVPSFDEVQESLGPELMGFMSEMLSEPGDTEKDEGA